MEITEGVWVFCGANSRLPSGVFKELATAEGWIEKNQLTGILTRYPLDTGLYDYASAKGWFKPRRPYPSHTSPEFKARFTCAYLPHHHYENGKREA